MMLYQTPTYRWQARLLVFAVVGIGPVVSYFTFTDRYAGMSEADTPSLWLFWTLLGVGGIYAIVLPLTWIATECYRSKQSIFILPRDRIYWRRVVSWILALGMFAGAGTNFISSIRNGVVVDAFYGLIVAWCGLQILASCGEPTT